MLKHGRRVSHAKEHYHGFEEATVGDEGGFPFVTILDLNIVISLLDVEFGEVLGILEAVNKIHD